MTAAAHTAALVGINSRPVIVSAAVEPGIAGLTIDGLSEAAAREARVRVMSALAINGHRFDRAVRVTVESLAGVSPAGFDVAIACAALAALGKIAPESLSRMLLLGELGLDGSLRPVRGVLAHLLWSDQLPAIVPSANSLEAAASGRQAFAAGRLSEVLRLLDGNGPAIGHLKTPAAARAAIEFPKDARALAREIIASGKRSVLLKGAPGSSLTLLARAIAAELSDLDDEATEENMMVYGAAGLLRDQPETWRARPFRAPHHTVSEAGLVGGGTVPRPGEASLANHGVLLLDEILEFRATARAALWTALDYGEASLYRGGCAVSFPARPRLVIGTAYPCPCGFHGHPRKACNCPPPTLERYASRLAPIARMFDLVIEVAP